MRLYIRLWLMAFKYLYRLEGFHNALIIMVFLRKKRSTVELTQLVFALGTIQTKEEMKQ